MSTVTGARFLVTKGYATEPVRASDLALVVTSLAAERLHGGLSVQLKNLRYKHGGARTLRDVANTFLPGY